MLSELIIMKKNKIELEPLSNNGLKKLTERKNNKILILDKNIISETVIEKIKKCTYFLYGDMQIQQTMYICGRCDFYQLDPICEACYNQCHKKCYKNEKIKTIGNIFSAKAMENTSPNQTSSKIKGEFKSKIDKKEKKKVINEQQKSANKGIKSFTCMCGKKHKHQNEKKHLKEVEKELERCNLENELHASLSISNEKLFCEECDIQICRMCTSGCHFFHNVINTPLDKDRSKCYCSNSNHLMNDFLLNSYFKDNTLKIKYPVLISSKTKTINMMFINRDLFHGLSKFLHKFLNASPTNLMKTFTHRRNPGIIISNLPNTNAENNHEENESKSDLKLEQNMRKFLEISGIFFNILNEKHDKCYFYNEELKSVFSYENSLLLIERLHDMENNSENSRMILNLVGIIFYLHLKGDFQRIKNFTISDFMGSKIVTRLRHKSKFASMLSFKENATEENSHILNPYANLKKYFNESSCLSTISIKLSKVIADCLPIMNIFANSTLYEVCLRFINFGLKKMYFTKAHLKSLIHNLFIFTNEFHQILNLPKNIQNLKQNLEATKFVFYYLIKICYLIAVNYNDIVIEKLVKKYKSTNELSVDENRKKFIHSNEKYGDKLLKMILKTVYIVSESYTYDIQLDRKIINICNESLKIFSIKENFYMGQINRLKDKEILAKHEYSFNLSPSFSLATKLRNKIENILIGDYANVLSGETELHLEIDQIFWELLRSVPTDSEHANRNKEEMDNPKKAKIFYYKLKLLDFFSDVLGYSSREEFHKMYSSLLNSETFVNDIISANFDEIISKYFSLFRFNSLHQNDINSAFSIYLLYFMDKRGVEHFCTGKNLAIITKLFSSPKNAKLLLTDEAKLEFLYLLMKGIFLYKIDLSNNKCIYNITAIIHLVLTEDEGRENKFNNLTYLDDIPFKAKQRMIKIFSILKDSFEFEEFERIQEIFFDKFKKLLEPNLFKSHIKDYEANNITPKRESVIKIGNELKLCDEAINKKFSKVTNNEIKSNLLETDSDNVRPNLIKKEEILKLNENNFTTTTICKVKSYALKFYFSFFRFLSIDTYYIFYDFSEEKAQLDEIHKFVDLEYMREILGKTFLPLNYRTNLLVFLRTFFFINILDSKGKSDGNSYITTEEMYKYLNKLYSPEELPEIEHKAQLIFKIIPVMDIFVSELEMFNKLLKSEPYYFEDVEQYLIQIVYSIKIISDFVYYQKSIWENVNWYMYKICKRFLQKANIIKNILLNIKTEGKVGYILDEDDEASLHMEQANFNIYNKDMIYNLISDSLTDILKATNLDKKFKLEKYLKEHDKKIQNDFTPPGVIHWKGFDELYKSNRKNKGKGSKSQRENQNKAKLDYMSRFKIIETSKVIKNPLVKLLKKVYKTTFIRVYDTCLMRVVNTIKTKDDSVDYRNILLDYFIKYISTDPENKKFFEKVSNKIYTEETTLTLLIIIVKLLYYDTKNTQNKFEYLNEKYIDPRDDGSASKNEGGTPDICKQFFKGFFNKLQKVFILNFSTSINFFMFDRYSEISEMNKLMIQFLQLLAEGFNVNFKSKIFELKLTLTESISIFDFIYSQFKTAYSLMNLHSKIANNNELSHYKLIVLFSNIADFFVEYIEGTDISNNSNKITQMIDNFFDDNIHKSLLTIINIENKSITTAKIELCKKLLMRVKSKILEVVIAFVENGVDEVFLKRIQKDLPMTRLFEEIQHHLHELLETIQNKAISENKIENKNILHVYKKKKNEFRYALTQLYILDDDFSDSLDLNFCLKLFMYLNILSDVYGIETINLHFAQKDNKAIVHNSVTSFLSPQAFKVYKFMKNIVRKVEVKNIEDNKITNTFFFRPPITFYLSAPTKRQFIDNVDRDCRFSKLSSLIKQTDFFMFEMVYYSHFNYIGRKINQYLDLYYLEIINYLLIVIQQIILLFQFYVSTTVPTADYQIPLSDKYIINKNSYILALVQIGYISFILILWFFFQFPLTLFSNLMAGDSTFLYQKEGEEKRDIICKFNQTSAVKGTLSHFDFLKNVNRSISFWKMLKVSLLDSLFINRTVNTFAFTLIFIILYLTTSSALFIVFPILFILNIVPILFGIFVALRNKWQQLATMIMFIFLCIYFYMWITFYFIYPIFTYSNIYLTDQGNQNTENLCTSAIECYLMLFDGFRSGGGIGDQLPFASWEQDISFYMIHFFYKMTFYIFIILILSNSCFGIIIDAFSDLRDRTNAIEEDKKNVCFTCQLSRDSSLNKGINFDDHVKKQHYIWNYVYFICHLVLNDPNEFNQSENYVWEKINMSTKEIGWIPGEREDNNN